MQVQFVVERIGIQLAVARRVNGVKLGEEVTEQEVLWPQVEDSGRVISFGTLVEEAIREAVELAEVREAGG
jgi:hypothetical protein